MVCRLMLFWPANHGDIWTMVVRGVSASLRTVRELMFMTCRLLPVGTTPPFSQDCWSADSGTGLPGSVPFVSHRPVSYGRLLLVVYVRWKTGLYDSGTEGQLAFDRWCSSRQHTYLCVCWRVSCCGVLFIQCWCLVFTLPEFWCLGLLRCHSTDVMDAPSYGSPVRTYVNNQYSMRVSNDVDCLDPKCLSSLGVVDLDLSMMCSAFRLLMWLNRLCACCRDSFPRTPVDDTGFGYCPEGFHDIVIKDLSATAAWQSRRLLPGDVTSFRRRWPKILFRIMRKRLMEMEKLRWENCDRPKWEFRHGHPGRCSLCQEYIATALDRHMMDVHLEFGQLWLCPVEWCTVRKDSLCDCLDHLHEKHGGSQYVAMNNLRKFPRGLSPETFGWRPFARMCLGVAVDGRLFHDSECRLVHKYRVYRDPFSHPALRGRVMNKLLAFVARAITITQLTQLHITIPASGSVTEPVPEDCFPPVPLPRALVSSRRISFACEVTVLGTAPEPTSLGPPALPDPVPVDLLDIQIHEPVYTLFPEKDTMDVSTVVSKPDFRCFLPRWVSITSSDHWDHWCAGRSA